MEAYANKKYLCNFWTTSEMLLINCEVIINFLLQTRHVYSTLKQRGNNCFHVVSTWNTFGLFVGMRFLIQKLEVLNGNSIYLLLNYLKTHEYKEVDQLSHSQNKTSIFGFYLILCRLDQQEQPLEVLFKKRCSQKFRKFTGKHLCKSLFFNKVAGLRHLCRGE